ncbi:DUF2058 domain-containing protein [Corallincola holothuriorum]|uniref:DUF2058 domain-containing protein n=1 Tax=Corallincola holothuriorum TaxID=2282215 RepID=A0A368NS23_9GAMM|nr:DUF2058 domain-containing protein [Corallincola holothuriorum]RCU52464.1 DUF2058 domain-containing protein [Corallincola holothuriorum]
MALSLQEQLLKAGLADKKKALKINKQKHQQRKSKKVETAESKQLAEQAKQEKLAKDRELNQQRKLEAEQKAITAQIRQIIETNTVATDNGDIAYNFTDGTKVKRLYTDAATHKQVTLGRLTIVKLDESYKLIPTAAADKIRQRDESYVIYCADQSAAPETDEEDPYADFQIPDDLMW